MKSYILASTMLLVSVLGAQAQSNPVLVSTEWLAEHASDPGLVILHVAMAHADAPDKLIEGARLLDYHSFADNRNGLRTELQPVDQMVDALREAGVSNESRVILYSSGSPHIPARIYMTLDYLGHGHQTSVLDGGIETWVAEHRPVAATATYGERGNFTPHLNDNVIVSADWIAERLDRNNVTLIDARPENEYVGERNMPTTRPGHIPGAYNLYFADLLLSQDQPILRSLNEVQARWDEAGADRNGVVVNYCLIGMRASYTYLISKHLGYEARFYDGSWDEWGARQDLPVVAGKSRR